MKKYSMILALLMATGCATLGFDTSDDIVEQRNKSDQQSKQPGDGSQDEDGTDEPETAAFIMQSAEVVSEEISFESHGEKLKGELVRPTDTSVKRPGVVIVHDSGPLSRDGIMRGGFGVQLPVEVAVYRTIAEDLASRGFVVLIWDKRTCITGSQPWCSYPRDYIDGHVDTMGEVLASDLAAAVGALRADERTTDEVHLVGHGQGAEIALVAQGVDAASLVLAAPNTQAPDEMVLTQIERSIEALRARTQAESNAETDQMVKQLESLEARQKKLTAAFSAIRKGEGEETAGLSANAWRDLIALHDAAAEAKPGVPMLIIDAGMDLDVDEESRVDQVEKWQAAGAEVTSFEDVTRPLVSVSEEQDPTSVSNQVTERLAAFLIAVSVP